MYYVEAAVWLLAWSQICLWCLASSYETRLWWCVLEVVPLIPVPYILITSPFRSFHWSVLIPFFHCIPIIFAQVVHVTVLPFNPIQLVVVNMLWLIVSIYSIWFIDGQVLVTPSRGSVMVLLMCTCWVIIPVWVLLSGCVVPFVLVWFYDGEMYSAPNDKQALQWKEILWYFKWFRYVTWN